MGTQRIWHLKYVAGNPAMFTRVITANGGPFKRSEALQDAKSIVANAPTWRVWVERDDGARIFESPAEIAHRQAAGANRIIEFARANVPGYVG